jgi:hypothetical protein
MPSQPEWSLTAAREPVRHEHAPPRNEPRHEPKPETVPEPAQAGPARKGWWQRNFKLGD